MPRRQRLTACTLSVLLAVGGTAVVAPLAAAPASAAVRTTVALTAPSTAELGSTYRLAVAVSPARPGTAVQLQRQVGGVWRASANGRLGSNSRTAFSVPAKVKGTYDFRVVRVAERGYAGAVSPVRRVTVKAKERLVVALPVTRAENGFGALSDGSGRRNVPGTVLGITYNNSLVGRDASGSRASVLEYDLGGQFASLRTTLGLDDRSPSGSLGTVELFGDGRSLGTWHLKPGTPVPVKVPVAGVKVLQVRSSFAGSDAEVVVGRPIVSTDTASGLPGDLTTFLSELTPTSGGGAQQDLWVQGEKLLGDTLDVGYIPGQKIEWNLARTYTRLVGGLGLQDGGVDDAETGSVTIYGDGKPLQTFTSGEGYTPVDLDVTGVLYLRVEIDTAADQGMDTYLVHPVLTR